MNERDPVPIDRSHLIRAVIEGLLVLAPFGCILKELLIVIKRRIYNAHSL